MARCGGKLNCEARARVNATTDIAGIGVLCAFLASALLTIGAIVYGYLSDSFPEWYLNETDRAKTKRILLLGRKPSRSPRKLSRQERQEAITRFILTLSDQQLATGLAILIAAIANQCELTVWEFQVAFSLAWFSSTTHLATLDCLRDYFISHGIVRNWRVLGMVVLLLMLVYVLIMAMASIETTIPVACTFEYFGDEAVDSHDPLDLYLVISAALTLVVLLWNYVVRILWSHRRTDGKATTLERTVFSMRTSKYWRKIKTSPKEWEYLIGQAVTARRSFIRRRDLEKIEKSNGLQRVWLVCNRASKIYSDSFLALGPMISFMVAFGFTQLYANRWHSGTPVTVEQSMNFGQITPLFLLVLPVFAAAEIYYEVQDQKRTGSVSKGIVNHSVLDTSSNTNSKSPASHQNSPPESVHADAESLTLEQVNRKYHDALPSIQRFCYTETKALQKLVDSITTSVQYTAVIDSEARLLTSYNHLRSLELSLTPTTLTSIIEFTLCCASCIALGILLNVEDPRAAPTIASIALFGLYLVYMGAGYVADIIDAWIVVSQGEYLELLDEAREVIRHQNANEKDVREEGIGIVTPVSSYATASSDVAPHNDID